MYSKDHHNIIKQLPSNNNKMILIKKNPANKSELSILIMLGARLVLQILLPLTTLSLTTTITTMN